MENPNNFIGPRPRGYFTFSTLIRQILGSGRQPHLYLIKRYAWWLIALVVVPPLLHDVVDYLTPRAPAEQLDLDREQRRLLFKLRYAIGGWEVQELSETDTSPAAGHVRRFCEAFRADFPANWRGQGRNRRAKTGVKEQRVKSKHLEECLRDVLAFDKRSDDAVAGALILADALHVRMRALCTCVLDVLLLLALPPDFLCIAARTKWRSLARLRSTKSTRSTPTVASWVRCCSGVRTARRF